MTIIVCVDDHGGMLFNRRRVSSDRIVTGKLPQIAAPGRLRIKPYSAKLFADFNGIYVGDDYLSAAGHGDTCFAEEQLLPADLNRASRVIVFHWNRSYPSDVKFPLEQLRKLAKLESVTEFRGNSHEKITQEVYALSKSAD